MSYNSILGNRDIKLTTPKKITGVYCSVYCGACKIPCSTIPIVSSSLELLFERFSKNTFITKNADVIPIWQRNSTVRSPVNSHQYTLTNSIFPNTEPIVSNSTFDDLSCDSGESLVDTTLSIFKDVASLFYYVRFNW